MLATGVGAIGLVLSLGTPGRKAMDSTITHVRSTTKDGTALDWRAGCPHLKMDAQAHPSISAEQLRGVLERAAAGWNGPTAECSTAQISVEPGVASGKKVGCVRPWGTVWPRTTAIPFTSGGR